MKTVLTTSIFLLSISFLFAQVGIGTATPTADLEVISKAAPVSGEFNGIIIPKVSVLPTGTNLPTAAQTGLILYLDSNNAAEGFYFFNGTAYINVTDNAINSPVFFNNGTVINATTTTANVSRSGNVSIGGNLNTGKLNVEVISASSSTTPSALRIINSITGTGADASHGMFSENRATSTGIKYGIRNEVSSSGNSNRIGIRNEVRNSTASDVNNVIGIDNFIGATDGTTTLNYGIRSEIGTAISDTNNFGVYSIARGADTRNNYSGYFRGDKFAIRSEDDSTGYNMPVNNGTSGQVLTTNGAGEASWNDLPAVADKDVVRANLNSTVAINSIASNNTDYFTIPFNTNPIDNNNRFDTSNTNHNFTASQDGLYEVFAQFHTEGEDNLGIYGIAIYVGNNLISVSEYQHDGNVFGSRANGIVNRSISDILELNANDVVTIRARFDDNINNNIDGSSIKTYVTIKQL